MRITKENISCWYELSWNDKRRAIMLRINEDFVKKAGNISEEFPIIIGFKAEYKFNSFKGNFSSESEYFGFDRSFKNNGLDKNFIEIEVELPILRKKSDEPCGFCNGTGKNIIFPDEVCRICKGRGDSYFYDWGKAFAISATFTTLFLFFNYPNFQINSGLKQLMTIETVTIRDVHGGSLGGDFSALLVNWLRKMKLEESRNLLTLVRKASINAYTKMDCRPLDTFDRYDFRIQMNNGRLIMDCPGDACGIHPSDSSDWNGYDGMGYKFSCHNIESPMQQLTLLAGLAALHDEARKEGVGVF